MVRIRLEIEKKKLFGRAFVRIRSKIEKNTLLVGLWLGLVQKKRKTPFVARLLDRVSAKIEKNTLFKWGFG